MKVGIYAAEGTLYNDDGKPIKNYEFVTGATIKNQAGTEIASVSGSDEYSFSIIGVISCNFIKHKDGPGGELDIMVNWTRRGTP